MSRFTTRSTVEACPHKIDVRFLARQRMLEPGTSSTLSWSQAGRKTGSIGVRAEPGTVYLGYSHAGEHVDETVALTVTYCHLGGTRHWFLCPSCERRCAILYGPGKRFACRLCYNLNYESQRNNGRSVSITRMHKVLDKLGAEPGATTFPGKPKWMHWRTYNRLHGEYLRQLGVISGNAQRFLDRLGAV